MIFLIVLLVIFVLFWLIVGKHLKKRVNDSVIMFCGGPGCGKTSTGVWFAWREVCKKRKRRKWRLRFHRKESIEMPYLYCNMPLFNVEYKKFDLDHLLRKKRFDYNSVIYLNEASLVADSMLAYNIGKDEARKFAVKQIQEFCKLIRHELRGKGVCLILDTQNPNDLCVAGDRVLNEMQLIVKHIDWIPFIRIVKARKVMINVEGITNVYKGELDDINDRWILVPKKVFKMYDSYCYCFLSDNLPKDEKSYFVRCRKKDRKKLFHQPFIIPTLSGFKDIQESNERLLKESEVIENGKEKD